eukprot:s3338_g1.t1
MVQKKAEAVQFAAYQQFCEKTEVEKKRIIADSKDKVEVLTAEIEKSGSDAAKLAEEIAGHLAELESVTAEKEAASKVRETERKDFQAMLKDYTESVDAIGRALKVLKAQAAPSLVQLKSLELPQHASRGLNVLLSEEEQVGEPSYEFQSGGVVTMLEKLEDKFVEERLQLEKVETSKKNAFDLLAATLTRKIEQATKEQQQKEGIKAKKLHDKASASGDLSETKVGLKTDEEYLAELVTTCTKKAADFKDRQKVRAEELVAIQEATKAMSEIAKPALLQKATSLAQLKQTLPDAAQAHGAVPFRTGSNDNPILWPLVNRPDRSWAWRVIKSPCRESGGFFSLCWPCQLHVMWWRQGQVSCELGKLEVFISFSLRRRPAWCNKHHWRRRRISGLSFTARLGQ